MNKLLVTLFAVALGVGTAETPAQDTLVAVPAQDEQKEEAQVPTVVPPAPVRPQAAATPLSRAAIESDRALLEEEGDEEQTVSTNFEALFLGGPYESADAEVQRQVLVRAESILRRHGFLDAGAGGDPAALEEALFRYQSAEQTRLTGRLDDSTVTLMRLMPRREGFEDLEASAGSDREGHEGRDGPEVYRGRRPRSVPSTPEAPPHDAVRGIWVR